MIVPLLAYLVVILGVVLFHQFLPKYTLLGSATLMISIPLLLEGRIGGINKSWKSLLMGFKLSFLLLIPYGLIMGFNLPGSKTSSSFWLYEMAYVAFPEEAFFRGYLQGKFKDPLRGIVVVSALFALAHALTHCIAPLPHCLKYLLTFFPSLVMGWLYYSTKSLWGSVLFHWLANVVCRPPY